MSVYQNAYDTIATSGQIIHDIDHALKKALLLNGLQPVVVKTHEHAEEFEILLVTGGNSAADSVPFFLHPYQLNYDGKTQFVLDARAYGAYSGHDQRFHIRKSSEFVFHMKRAILNQVMVDCRPETLRDISAFPMKAYANLVSQAIARRLALELVDQTTLAILAAYFYVCLFTDVEGQLDEHEMTLLQSKIARDLRLPAQVVTRVLQGLPVIHSLVELADTMRERVENVAMQSFNHGLLIASLSGTWMGTGASEVLGVGLEHIPTWLTIVASSTSSQVYKRSTLSKIIQKLDHNNEAKNFVRALDVFIGGPNAITMNGEPVVAYQTHYE